jgi:hypothetical protein
VLNRRFALDEDVSHPLASLLRLRGLDVDSAKELGRLRLTDTQVLLLAAQNNQTLITHNDKYFRALHEAWVTWRRRWSNELEQAIDRHVFFSQHAGILILPHRPIHDLARMLEEFEASAGSLENRLFAWNPRRQWHELHF